MTSTVKVEARENVTVDGLGTFYKGEQRTLTVQDAISFALIRGLPLDPTNVPELTFLVEKES